MPNPFLYIWTVLFQTILLKFWHFSFIQFTCQKQFYLKLFSLVSKIIRFQTLWCITNNLIKHQLFIYSLLNVKTVLFPTTQFSISIQFSSIWQIGRTLSGATTPGQSGPGSDGKKGVLRIPQSYSITRGLLSEYYVQDTRCWSLILLQRCSRFILQPPLTEPSNLMESLKSCGSRNS